MYMSSQTRQEQKEYINDFLLMRTKWCRVQILKNGRTDWPYEYAVVAGKVSGLGLHTADFRTDDRGFATIEWYGGDHLVKIYVSGKTFDGPFEEGKTYRLPY